MWSRTSCDKLLTCCNHCATPPLQLSCRQPCNKTALHYCSYPWGSLRPDAATGQAPCILCATRPISSRSLQAAALTAALMAALTNTWNKPQTLCDTSTAANGDERPMSLIICTHNQDLVIATQSPTPRPVSCHSAVPMASLTHPSPPPGAVRGPVPSAGSTELTLRCLPRMSLCNGSGIPPHVTQ